MKRLIYILFLSLLIVITTASCDITKLTEQYKGKQIQTEDKEDNSNTAFVDQIQADEESKNTYNERVKINHDIKYEVTKNDGYYTIGPLNGHIINIKWDGQNSVNFRVNDGEKNIITNCVINDDEINAKSLIESTADGIYVNDSLQNGKGLVFTSWINESSFYIYKNNELKEYKNIQYYTISPLQKYIILFAGDYKTSPILIDIDRGNEINLPIEMDHGWPEYAVGLSFSADETHILYEDWSKMQLCIYDIKNQKLINTISEDGYSLFEGALSPDGRRVAYLKYDNTKEPMKLFEGRNPIGNTLVVYDIEKKKILNEIPGEEFLYLKPIWSPNGKYLAFNMVQIGNDNGTIKELNGSPCILNIATGKITKLENTEKKLKYAVAWSEDNNNILICTKSQDNRNKFSALDTKLNDEFPVDNDKYYISNIIKLGTNIYEIISIENSKLGKFTSKTNIALSSDEKYVAFSATIDNREYLIIAPRQEVK